MPSLIADAITFDYQNLKFQGKLVSDKVISLIKSESLRIHRMSDDDIFELFTDNLTEAELKDLVENATFLKPTRISAMEIGDTAILGR